MEKTLNNNQVIVAGEIASDFTFSHEIFGEGFYMVDLVVARLSDTYDVIPLMVSDRLFDVENSHIGEKVVARGQFRSYNKHEETRNRLILSVFVREISVLDDEEDEGGNKPNQIYLDGYICKEPVYRMTPLGREIADILLAVNRAYGKSDYIPCICWGRNARFASGLKESSVDWHQSPIWIIAASPFASIFSDVSQSTSSGLSGPYSTARSRNL